MRRALNRRLALTRRHLAGSAFVLLALLAACGQAASGASSTAAPPLSLYVVSSHVSSGHGGSDTLSALRASDGRIQWSVALTGQNRGPAVASGGMVYVGGETGSVKSGPGALTAVRAQDGKQLWEDHLGGLYATTAIPGQEAVYTSTNAGVYGLRARDGHILWQFQANQPWFSPPLIVLASGTLYAAVGAFSPENAAALYALRASDGKVLWHFNPPDGVNESQVGVTVRGDHVYLNSSAHLYALHGADGTLAWSTPTADWDTAVTDDVAYVVSGAGAFCTPTLAPVPQVTTVTAHRASDGAVLWTAHVDGMPHLFATATSRAIYLAVETGDIQCQAAAHQAEVFNPTADTLVALGSADGAVLGKQTVTAPLFFTALQADANVVYVTAIPAAPTTGTVYALDASAGTTLWHHDIDQLGYWLDVAQGAVYIEGTSGSAPGSAPATLYALRASDGSTRWSTQQVGSGDLLPPAVGR